MTFSAEFFMMTIRFVVFGCILNVTKNIIEAMKKSMIKNLEKERILHYGKGKNS